MFSSGKGEDGIFRERQQKSRKERRTIMKMNMNQWVKDTIAAPKKKALPVLSFPSIQKLGITVKELISDSELQAKGMKTVADAVDAAASLA